MKEVCLLHPIYPCIWVGGATKKCATADAVIAGCEQMQPTKEFDSADKSVERFPSALDAVDRASCTWLCTQRYGWHVSANYAEVEKCAQSTENLPIDLVEDRASCTWMGSMLL